jgi:hypothetical protein
MQVPSILLGESRTRLLQGIAIGAIASMAIGFSWGGWVTGATANKLAADQAGAAVVAVLTPICVEKFLQNSAAQANLAALREISSNWQQGQYLEKGGWATRPGATSSDYELGLLSRSANLENKRISELPIGSVTIATRGRSTRPKRPRVAGARATPALRPPSSLPPALSHPLAL